MVSRALSVYLSLLASLYVASGLWLCIQVVLQFFTLSDDPGRLLEGLGILMLLLFVVVAAGLAAGSGTLACFYWDPSRRGLPSTGTRVAAALAVVFLTVCAPLAVLSFWLRVLA